MNVDQGEMATTMTPAAHEGSAQRAIREAKQLRFHLTSEGGGRLMLTAFQA
jgi:hypothetical protein